MSAEYGCHRERWRITSVLRRVGRGEHSPFGPPAASAETGSHPFRSGRRRRVHRSIGASRHRPSSGRSREERGSSVGSDSSYRSEPQPGGGGSKSAIDPEERRRVSPSTQVKARALDGVRVRVVGPGNPRYGTRRFRKLRDTAVIWLTAKEIVEASTTGVPHESPSGSAATESTEARPSSIRPAGPG